MINTGDRSKSSKKTRQVPLPNSHFSSSSWIRRAKTTCDVFRSAKTAIPIPAHHPALFDALIQATLDPLVRAIRYVPSAIVAAEKVRLDAIVLQRDDGSFLLDVVPARRICNPAEQQLTQIALAELDFKHIVLTAEETRQEPRRTNARLVWSHRGNPIPIGLRLRILLTLADEGPMPLGELLKNIRSEVDPAPAVMALACADLLVLDLAFNPLGPRTITRSR